MDTPINPLVDYAFKLLLGAQRNASILVDFLNAVLKPEPPIQNVHVLNPFNSQEFDEDKLTIVDVKATDEAGRTYQIEVQLDLRKTLQARALFNWARIYGAQLEKGEDYSILKPVISIWILDGVLFRDSTWVHHRFRMVDERSGTLFSDHLQVHLLQLGRFEAQVPLDDEDQWVYFLKEARNWTELPAELETPALRLAMDQLKTISQSARDLERYRAREDYLRLQLTIENERKQTEQDAAQAREDLERTRQDIERTRQALSQTEQAALSQTEQARLQAEQARLHAERERDLLRQKLQAAGIDPDI